MSVSKKCFALLLISVAFVSPASGQQMSIDTREIESVIDEWMFANNGRNLESFRRVYADQLLFYTQNLSATRAIGLKQQFFKLKPFFSQRITTPITYTAYTSGVIKCDFKKEVFEKTHWKEYPSYLLVSYQDNKYRIVGESDVATDRVLKYSLKLGDPIILEDVAQQPDSVTADSSSLAVVSDRFFDSMKSFFSGGEIDLAFPDMSAMGVVAVPKGYVYMLIVLLMLGGLMIFIADSVQARKRQRRNAPVIRKSDEAERAVKDFKLQSLFEAFVITLFDPLYFKYERPKQERVIAGDRGGRQAAPDLIFQFRQKETEVRFGIVCRYHKYVPKNEVQITSPDVRGGLQQFEQDLYYVLGFGGTPDDPKEFYCVPAGEVNGEYMTRVALREYSKSGMFYYNRRTGRIQ